MRRVKIVLAGLLLSGGLILTGCVDEEALAPPTRIQLACDFGDSQRTMTLVVDTGLETADWLNLAEPRQGQLRVFSHQYQLDFPAVGRAPAVHARINRYDGTIMGTFGAGANALSQAGLCAKEEAGPRL